jgi:hypothetical protein
MFMSVDSSVGLIIRISKYTTHSIVHATIRLTNMKITGT